MLLNQYTIRNLKYFHSKYHRLQHSKKNDIIGLIRLQNKHFTFQNKYSLALAGSLLGKIKFPFQSRDDSEEDNKNHHPHNSLQHHCMNKLRE